MAKRAARGKPEHRKRETSAQRAEREHKRRITLQMADYVADRIHSRRQNKADLAPEDMEDLPAKKLKKMGWHPESKYWRQVYTYLGQVFCEFDENPAKFFRLVADSLEAEHPLYHPTANWYDGAITEAYKAAAVSHGLEFSALAVPESKFSLVPYIIMRPSYPEFEKVFRKQNPKLQVSGRVLRRALQRLGYFTSPARRGRPKKK